MGKVMCGPNTDRKALFLQKAAQVTTRRDSATFYTDLSEGSFQTRQNKNITDGLAFQGSSQFVRAPEDSVGVEGFY